MTARATAVQHWQREIALAPTPDAKLKTFANAIRDLGRAGNTGDNVELLKDMALANNHFGLSEPEIEIMIANEIARDRHDHDGAREQLDFEAEVERIRRERKAREAQTGNGDGGDKALRLTFFDQLIKAAPKPWLIKNVMARGETSSWIAPPGIGKSALITETAVHLALGKDWRGYRTKACCGVVYFALERADLVRRRLTAHRLRDKLPNLPIAVAGDVIDLMHKSCVEIIVATINRAEQHFGCEVGLAIIDTYPKGIAAGGGDESSAKDQNIALTNLRRVLDRVHIHIAGIGHTGKDESKGERGSNARLADVDVMVQISGQPTRTATVIKANDQPEGPLISFQLEPFDFGRDEDGDPFRTFILSKDVITGFTPKASRLSDQQRLALDALSETILTHGHDAPAEYSLPQGIKVADAEKWKTELQRRNVLDPKASNPRARFNELRKRLAAKRLIGTRDDLIWNAHPEKQ
jgi:AAA domain